MLALVLGWKFLHHTKHLMILKTNLHLIWKMTLNPFVFCVQNVGGSF